jgi:hypothetical protein
MAVMVTRKERRNQILALKPEYLECRENHDWQTMSIEPIRTPVRGYLRTRECRRCEMEKKQILRLSRAGGTERLYIEISWISSYPDGYLMKGGRMTKDELAWARFQQIEQEIIHLS